MLVRHLCKILICSFLHFAFLYGEKVAMITGITGQDGSYLTELLLDKGYIVHGLVRRSATSNTANIEHLQHNNEFSNRLFLHFADLSDVFSICRILEKVKPDEIYNLAAQSDVRLSYDLPEQTSDISGMGVLRILEANRLQEKRAKVYQASTSELFGSTTPPQSEQTSFHPRSPYAVAKLYGYWMGVNYREAYQMYVSNGILFNHESPRRGVNFITRKITKALAAILAGKQSVLELGNLDALRDWGFAPDYVECMWAILQQEKPGDFVIGTGKQYSVRDFVKEAFQYVGVDIEWVGEGVSEVGIIKTVSHLYKDRIRPGQVLIRVNPLFFRPAEVDSLLADPSKAKQHLQWESKVNFQELVKIMVDSDLKRQGLAAPGEGQAILANRYKYVYESL